MGAGYPSGVRSALTFWWKWLTEASSRMRAAHPEERAGRGQQQCPRQERAQGPMPHALELIKEAPDLGCRVLVEEAAGVVVGPLGGQQAA